MAVRAAANRVVSRWFTEDLFRTDDANIGEAINDAIAALIYVVPGNLLSKLILRLAPSATARA